MHLKALCIPRHVFRGSITKTLLVMKLTAIILLAGALQVSAGGYSQKVSLSVKDAPLQNVLKEIKKQTGYVFFYDQAGLYKSEKVSIRVKDAELEVALAMIFKNQPLEYNVVNKTVVIRIKKELDRVTYQSVLQPSDIITGVITDQKGEPLPGVSVIIKGTDKGVRSDADGKFSINANAGDVLEFSIVGYSTQVISVGNKTSLTIQMQIKNADMQEVVIVGLGNKQKKISVVGALSTITTKELKQSPVANLSNALAGRLPGLITVQSSNDPGAGSALFIRGIGTSGPNNTPLFVIDGLPRGGGDFSQLDANEIETVTILKDASSTALYGIQGANGVVVVTTKRGKLNQKPQISFTAQSAVQKPIRLPKMMDAYNLALWDNESNASTIWTQDDLDKIKAGTDPYTYPDVNWFDFLLKENAPQQQYNLNFTGGSQFAKYFVSGSYVKQGSLFDHEDDNNYGSKTNFNRYNFRSNIDLQVNSRLNLQVDMAGRLEERAGPGAGYGTIFTMLNRLIPNMTAVFNPDGSIAHGSKVVVPSDNNNPYAALTRTGYYNDYWSVMYGTFSANHKLDFITKGLSAQVLFTFQNNSFKGTRRQQDYDSYWYRGLDASGNPIYQKVRSATSLVTSGSSSAIRNNYLDFRINYDRTFGDHSVTAQLLGNRTLTVDNDQLPFAYQGVSGRITYGYKNKYFAEVNTGYNGSENFPKGSRYGLFPAFSAGWVVSNENFFPNTDLISFLKIRGSYGLVGNDKVGGDRFLFISDYAPGGGYGFGTGGNINPGGYNENRVGNTNVTWEKSKKMNLGIEATLLKSFAKITFDVFREERNNILLAAGTVPAYIGISNLAPRNTGEVLNRGFEVELQLNKKIKRYLTLFSNLQVTYARNKVLENDQPAPAYPYQNLKGYEIGYQLGYKAIGIFKDQKEIDNSPVQTFAPVFPGDIKYLDVNKDGFVNALDRVAIQIQNVPRYVFGASFGASYKGMDISFLLNGAMGATTYLGNNSLDYVLRGRKIWEQRWSPTNTENPILPSSRRTPNNVQTSTFWIAKSDYLKLRNAEIGYELPVKLIKRVKLNYVRIYINGQNLAVWDKLWVKEQDPESAGSTTGYPAQRTINVGLNIRL